MQALHRTLAVSTLAGVLALALAGCDRAGSDSADAGASPTAQSSGASGTSSGAAGVGNTVGTALDDTLITTKVKAALMADNDIKGSDIQVETKKGEVMLSGFVGDKAQTDKAITIASAVSGVKKVTDKTSVKP